MKKSPLLKRLCLLTLCCALYCFINACQEEEGPTTTTENTENLITNTTAVQLLQRVTMLDGSPDNIIDNANCFQVALPVTVSVNGVTVQVNSTNDFGTIAQLLQQTIDTNISLNFPITIILSDYTEILIENQAALEAQLENCTINQADIDIECIDIQYPITIALYDTAFEVTETVTISNDAELYLFLGTIDADTIASINYPITVMLYDGNSVLIENNEELINAIEAAINACDEDDDTNYNDDDCEEVFIMENLIECAWHVFNPNDMSSQYIEFSFNIDGTLTYNTASGTANTLEGNWQLTIEDESLVFQFANLSGEAAALNGSWNLEECEEDRFVFYRNGQTIIFEQDCDDDTVFDCFDNLEITVCDDDPVDGFTMMNLEELLTENIECELPYSFAFYETLADAEAEINQIPTLYTNTNNPQILYLRIADTNGNFEIFTFTITIEDCCTNTEVLVEDLVVYIPFGNQTKDLISGWESNQTLTYVEDRDGNSSCALAFNGNQTIEIPVTVANKIVQGDAFSVSLWFKMQNTNASNYEVLFQKGAANTEGFQLAVYDLNTPLFSDSTSGYGLWDNDWNMDTQLPDDITNWHHLVVTVDENNTVRLYRDGTQRNADENSSINIGSDALVNYILGNGFEGHLDDIRVYKKALNPNEINTLYELEADCYTCL